MSSRLQVLAVTFCAATGVAGCGTSHPRPDADSTCPEAEARLGHRVCVHRIPDLSLWQEIGYSTATVDQVRATTYLSPARTGARFETLFVDASSFEQPDVSLHYKFLSQSFDEFELLEYQEYVDLVLPQDREWFAGNLTEYQSPGGESVFGFTVWDLGGTQANTINCSQYRQLFDELDAQLDVEPLRVVPATNLQREVLRSCDVPTYDPGTALAFELYSASRGCGTLRLLTATDLAGTGKEAELSWQDVLVMDEAPLDLETVVAAVVTGTRQGELSHLNVRSASRGTPNCYVRDAYQVYQEWEGLLVSLECTEEGAIVAPISPDEAQVCWEATRPDPAAVEPADVDWTQLVGLLELPTETAEERRLATSRFGAKGTNLAVLYQRIDPALQLQGFLVPFHYYLEFIRSNSWVVDLGQGPETLSFEEAIDRLLEDPGFRTNGVVRRDLLAKLQDAMMQAPCDPMLLGELEGKLQEVFGADDVMVRFRSSSNAEDSLEFSGAGLYTSTSVCLADELDNDAVGPSRCDADKSSERDMCRGLRTVYSSLWNPKAYEEREWYGIDHAGAAMGILVNTRSKNELANIVAFTGNPLVDGDERYLVNAQLGELDVVSSLPGVFPEKVLLTLDSGAVAEIDRARLSSEVPPGEWVLQDDELELLGAALLNIRSTFPLDGAAQLDMTVLLDTEWKVLSDGRLIVKQVRPFLD